MHSCIREEIKMCELTILMPCLNEAETLNVCIQKEMRAWRP